MRFITIILLCILSSLIYAEDYSKQSDQQLQALLAEPKQQVSVLDDLERGAFLETLVRHPSPELYERVRIPLLQLVENSSASTRRRWEALRVIRLYRDDRMIENLKKLIAVPDSMIVGEYKSLQDDKDRLYIETITTLYNLERRPFHEIASKIQELRDKLFGWDSGELYSELFVTLPSSFFPIPKDKDAPEIKMEIEMRIAFLKQELEALDKIRFNYSYSRSRFRAQTEAARNFVIRHIPHILDGSDAVRFLNTYMDSRRRTGDDDITEALLDAYRTAATHCSMILDSGLLK